MVYIKGVYDKILLFHTICLGFITGKGAGALVFVAVAPIWGGSCCYRQYAGGPMKQ